MKDFIVILMWCSIGYFILKKIIDWLKDYKEFSERHEKLSKEISARHKKEELEKNKKREEFYNSQRYKDYLREEEEKKEKEDLRIKTVSKIRCKSIKTEEESGILELYVKCSNAQSLYDDGAMNDAYTFEVKNMLPNGSASRVINDAEACASEYEELLDSAISNYYYNNEYINEDE